MPHDVNGRLLAVGDTVNLPCKVTGVYEGEDACNLSLETLHPLYPGTHKTAVTINAKQCYLVESATRPEPFDPDKPAEGNPSDAPTTVIEPKPPAAA